MGSGYGGSGTRLGGAAMQALEATLEKLAKERDNVYEKTSK